MEKFTYNKRQVLVFFFCFFTFVRIELICIYTLKCIKCIIFTMQLICVCVLLQIYLFKKKTIKFGVFKENYMSLVSVDAQGFWGEKGKLCYL